MKKQLVLGTVFGAIVLGLGFSNFTRATVTLIDNGVLSMIAITPSDLGVDSVGILPTSRFYFLKEFGQGIRRLFTFGALNKAAFEFDTANHKAAELIAVEKEDVACAANAPGGGKHCQPGDKVGRATLNALQNFTNAQERLNSRISTVTNSIVFQLGTPDNPMERTAPNLAKLLKEVDEKTALHVALLEQLTQEHAGDPDFDLLRGIVGNALNNTLKTFTFTVTNTGNAPTGTLTMQQKAAGEITRAEDAIKKAETVFGQPVTFTATTTVTTGASSTITGTDQGIAIGHDGINQSIPGITLVINNVAGEIQVIRTATTGPDGTFAFTGLAPGTYDLSIAGQRVLEPITVDVFGIIKGNVYYLGTPNGPGIRRIGIVTLVRGTVPTPTGVPGVSLKGTAFVFSEDVLSEFIIIANAKGHLASAQEMFAGGKYGEAYGQARSAEAIISGIQSFDTEMLQKTAPTPSPIVSPAQSPNAVTPSPSPKATASPTVRPTPEKTEAPQPSATESAAPTPTPTPTENPMGTVTPTPTETGSAL